MKTLKIKKILLSSLVSAIILVGVIFTPSKISADTGSISGMPSRISDVYSVASSAYYEISNSNGTVSQYRDYWLISKYHYYGSVTLKFSSSSSTTYVFHFHNSTESVHVRLSGSSNPQFVYSSDTLVNMEEYTYPVESFNVISYMSNRYQLYDLFGIRDMIFPSFKVPNNSACFTSLGTQLDETYHLIFCVNRNISSTGAFSGSIFTIDNGTITSFHVINRYDVSGNYFTLLHLKIHRDASTSNTRITITNTYGSDLIIIPIYFNNVNRDNISTDFALNFGLSNQLLDDVHYIAENINGNQTSESSVDNLDDKTDDLTDVITNFDLVEDGFNDDLNNNLDNIDLNFSFGNSFLQSANWVRTQYDNIVTGTPFASLITFTLILGLGLLLIGRLL